MASDPTFIGKPVVARIATFDRLIFKGYLTSLRFSGTVLSTLTTMGLLLLKDWKSFIEPLSQEIHDHLESWCQREGRPFEYLEGAHTHRGMDSKESMAREIAARDGITSGLVCVFRVLESSSSFDVRGNWKTHRLELIRRRRRCLHYYAYMIDPRFGWMHVRIQSWIPFTIQVYVNGREWLCRQLDRRKVTYRRSDNKVISVSNLAEVHRQNRRLERMDWPKVLGAWSRMVNPLIDSLVGRDGKKGYFWVIDQCEFATDLLFKDRATVDSLMPDIKLHSHTTLSVRDCYRFLGKRESRSEAVIDLKQRPEGWRGKFRLGRNWMKIYDHRNVLRFETTINHPAAFTAVRRADAATSATNTTSGATGSKPMRTPLRKGVQDFWLLARIAADANQRMIDAFDPIRTTRPAIDQLDRLSRPRICKGKRIPRIHPTAAPTIAVFKAVADGDGHLRGFTNGDIQRHLYQKPARGAIERRRRTCRVYRYLTTLRGHGIIARIPGTRRYRLTKQGRAAIQASIRFHDLDFPAFRTAS